MLSLLKIKNISDYNKNTYSLQNIYKTEKKIEKNKRKKSYNSTSINL